MMKMRTALVMLIAGLATAVAVACGGDSDDGGDDGKLNVTASTTIVADLVRQVGGDRVEVTSIIPNNTDPHTFALAPSHIRLATDADLVIVVGASLITSLEEGLIQNAGGAVLTLTEGMDLRPFPEGLAHSDEDEHEHEEEEGDEHEHEEGDEHEHEEGDDHDHEEEEGHDEDEADHHEEDGDGHDHDEEEAHEDDADAGHDEEEAHEDEDEHAHDDEDEHGHEDEDEHGHDEEEGHDGHDHGMFDPHFWMDVDLVIIGVEAIRDELIRLDADGADHYRERASAYIAELRKVDEEIAEQLAGLPEERRYLVSFHDAYGYFAARYGLTLVGFVVESSEEEPSATAITELVESIEELGIPFIYKETGFSARVIEQIASDTGATVKSIPAGSLSEEYPTYVEFLRALANAIAE